MDEPTLLGLFKLVGWIILAIFLLVELSELPPMVALLGVLCCVVFSALFTILEVAG